MQRRVRLTGFAAVVLLALSACVGAPAEPSTTDSVVASVMTSRCPGLDLTLSDLIALGRPEARECFGDSQLTIRGWVWEDRGAYDCMHFVAPGDPVPPDWLYCTMYHSRLTTAPYLPGEPVPGYIHPVDGPFLVAVDPASPAAGALRPNQWVEVVGRFEDPATELCELVRDPNFRDECLSTFVVADARVIDAP